MHKALIFFNMAENNLKCVSLVMNSTNQVKEFSILLFMNKVQ